jgi:hypothetical protein
VLRAAQPCVGCHQLPQRSFTHALSTLQTYAPFCWEAVCCGRPSRVWDATSCPNAASHTLSLPLVTSRSHTAAEKGD